MAAAAACQQFGIYFDPDDPYSSESAGYRLGRMLKERIETAEREANDADRELKALDREATARKNEKDGKVSRLKEQLAEVQQRFETPETRKAREEKAEAERKKREEARKEKEEADKKVNESIRKVAEQLKANPKEFIDDVVASMVPIPGKDYRMGKTEVTQVQWMAVMGDNPSYFTGANNPVENVSWDDCQEFLKKLNALPEVKKTGLVFRLPTDAEWEYACRAGATEKFCKLADGTEIAEDTLGRVAWFEDNSEKETHPVGQKEPNAFGLYDMHGNLCEWCQNEIGEVRDYAKGKNFEHDRVYRGGSWRNSARSCGSSCRHWISPGNRFHDLGFRLCASVRAD